MDVNFVKALISKVEFLGVDTQTLRDLLTLSQTGEVVIANYSQALKTLDSVLNSKLFEGNSQPPQISMLLKQLERRLQNRHLEGNNTQSQTKTDPSQDLLTSEILTSLLDIKSTLSKINQGPTQQIVYNQNAPASKDPGGVEMPTVFVNPIDEAKVDNIKANVSIDSKVGDNIQNKLDRLKNLKKGI